MSTLRAYEITQLEAIKILQDNSYIDSGQSRTTSKRLRKKPDFFDASVLCEPARKKGGNTPNKIANLVSKGLKETKNSAKNFENGKNSGSQPTTQTSFAKKSSQNLSQKDTRGKDRQTRSKTRRSVENTPLKTPVTGLKLPPKEFLSTVKKKNFEKLKAKEKEKTKNSPKKKARDKVQKQKNVRKSIASSTANASKPKLATSFAKQTQPKAKSKPGPKPKLGPKTGPKPKPVSKPRAKPQPKPKPETPEKISFSNRNLEVIQKVGDLRIHNSPKIVEPVKETQTFVGDKIILPKAFFGSTVSRFGQLNRKPLKTKDVVSSEPIKVASTSVSRFGQISRPLEQTQPTPKPSLVPKPTQPLQPSTQSNLSAPLSTAKSNSSRFATLDRKSNSSRFGTFERPSLPQKSNSSRFGTLKRAEPMATKPKPQKSNSSRFGTLSRENLTAAAPKIPTKPVMKSTFSRFSPINNNLALTTIAERTENTNTLPLSTARSVPNFQDQDTPEENSFRQPSLPVSRPVMAVNPISQVGHEFTRPSMIKESGINSFSRSNHSLYNDTSSVYAASCVGGGKINDSSFMAGTDSFIGETGFVISQELLKKLADLTKSKFSFL